MTDKWMLITVCDRDITVAKFPSLVMAQEAMLHELHKFGGVDGARIGDMYDEYEVEPFEAWSNARNDMSADWKIVSIFDENAITTRADKVRAMTDREMATELIDMIADLCEDGVPSPDYVLEWLWRPADGGNDL